MTLASVKTVQGPVVIMLHRIRYLGKVALCMSESNESGTGQSCANYPVGPKSNQDIGNAPVWWTTYVGACTSHHFQLISGVVLRAGLTAWLRTPGGLSRIPTATVPKAFGVAGELLYALIASYPDTVTLREASGKSVYTAPVEPLTGCRRCSAAPVPARQRSSGLAAARTRSPDGLISDRNQRAGRNAREGAALAGAAMSRPSNHHQQSSRRALTLPAVRWRDKHSAVVG